MITGDKQYLDQIVGTHRCPDHPKLALTVAWKEEFGYHIHCGGNHIPEEVTKVQSPSQRTRTAPLPPVDDSLNLVPQTDLATGALLDPDRVHALVSFAERYGLDAQRQHVYIMHGKPYIGIDGYLYHANKLGKPYRLESHPLTSTEREDYQILPGGHSWLAKVTKDDGASSFNGLGIVTLEEMEAKSSRDKTKLRSPVVAAHPWQLAQKRAEWQALRRAFPIGESDNKEKE